MNGLIPDAMAQSAGVADSARHTRLKAGMTELVLGEARHQHWTLSREAILEIFAGDIELNAQGLGIWLDTGAAIRT